MIYIIIVILVIVILFMPSQNQSRMKNNAFERERLEREKLERKEVRRKEIQDKITNRREERVYRDVKRVFGDFILHEIQENGCFVIPDVGLWKVNKPSWPVSFTPRKSLKKQVRDGELDKKRQTKSNIEYARNYEIWFRLSRAQRTREKLSTERQFYLRLFEFYCNTRLEKKNIRFLLINANKHILEDVILFTNDLRNEIIENLVSSKPIEIDTLGSLSVKFRKINVHGRESETKKIYFHPKKELIAHCKKLISIKS